MTAPLRCAHCGKVESREGFVAVTEDCWVPTERADGLPVFLVHGDVIRIECARALGAAIPETTSYLLHGTF